METYPSALRQRTPITRVAGVIFFATFAHFAVSPKKAEYPPVERLVSLLFWLVLPSLTLTEKGTVSHFQPKQRQGCWGCLGQVFHCEQDDLLLKGVTPF